MRIIPVIDLKGGQVVHAVGGRREQYRAIRSCLVDSSCPETVARAFRDKLGLHDLYVADLDAIAGREPAWAVYATLASMNLRLMVDAGVRDAACAQAVRTAGASGVVIGLETIGGPRPLREIVDQIGANAVWFSLDLKDGAPLGNVDAWHSPVPEQIAAEVMSVGVTRQIVLDLANVGERRGTGTERLCEQLIAQHPQIELVAGGGIRSESDLKRLDTIGLAGALVATALHDGTLLTPLGPAAVNTPRIRARDP